MTLPAQYLSEIVAHVRFIASRGAGAEKRRTARLDIQYHVRVTPFAGGDGGPPFTVLTRDISQEGLGVFTARAMRTGELVIVCLPRNDRDTVFLVTQVMFCVPKADGLYSAGMKFIKQVDRAAVHELEDSGAGADERKRIAESVVT